jgi:hypothetical protein
MGERSEMGRYEVPTHGSLLGLGIGMILASFQICGVTLEFSARFHIYTHTYVYMYAYLKNSPL